MSKVENEDILQLYKAAKNKAEEILILVDLTDSDEETVIEALKDAGLFKPEDIQDSLRTCTQCGRKYIASTKKGKAICKDCVKKNRLDQLRKHQEKVREKVRQAKEAENTAEKPEEPEAAAAPGMIILTADDLRKIIRQEVIRGVLEAIQGIRVTLPFDPWER